MTLKRIAAGLAVAVTGGIIPVAPASAAPALSTGLGRPRQHVATAL